MELLQLFNVLAQERSRYLKEFRKEHEVIPALCGLPRIIRAFIGER